MPTESEKLRERLILELEELAIVVEGYKAVDATDVEGVKWRSSQVAQHAQRVVKAAYDVKDGAW